MKLAGLAGCRGSLRIALSQAGQPKVHAASPNRVAILPLGKLQGKAIMTLCLQYPQSVAKFHRASC